MSEEMIFLSQRTRNLTFTALFAAVIAVCAQITVPMPSGVSFTLQTFAVALAGYLLGAKYGTLTVLVYLLLGAVGAPVFSAFHGGFHILLGKTGGYLWGFLPMAFLCGLAARGRGRCCPISGACRDCCSATSSARCRTCCWPAAASGRC